MLRPEKSALLAPLVMPKRLQGYHQRDRSFSGVDAFAGSGRYTGFSAL